MHDIESFHNNEKKNSFFDWRGFRGSDSLLDPTHSSGREFPRPGVVRLSDDNLYFSLLNYI